MLTGPAVAVMTRPAPSTVATVPSLDAQLALVVRSTVVLSAYVPVARSCTAVPAAIVIVAGETAMDTSGAGATEKVVLAVKPP
jgi:hypothetical protein